MLQQTSGPDLVKRFAEVSLRFGKVYLAEVDLICFFLHLPDSGKRFVE